MLSFTVIEFPAINRFRGTSRRQSSSDICMRIGGTRRDGNIVIIVHRNWLPVNNITVHIIECTINEKMPTTRGKYSYRTLQVS